MVEQWTHKPLVVGSNPTLATIVLRAILNSSLTIDIPIFSL